MSNDSRTLRVEFSSEDDFRREYESNIANGGIFIATRSDFRVREPVDIEIVASYCGESVALAGEVVHCVPAEMAKTGATQGIAVHFVASAAEVRDAFRPLAGPLGPENERLVDSGRRAAPRSTARVMADVHAENGVQISGRTRNLSLTGALVSVDDDSIGVGQPVTVVLHHPVTDETMDVAGRVARHLKSPSGDTIAMGIHFEVPKASEDELHNFISALKSCEHSRRLGGICGPISEVGIENVLQMFGTCSPAGTLTVSNEGEEGHVLLEQGMIRSARVGRMSGMDALARMLSWTEGNFEFQSRVDSNLFEGAPLPLEAAMLEALRQVDERARDESESLHTFGFDLDATLFVGADPEAELREDLTKAESAIVELASVGMSIRKLLQVIPEPEQDVITSLADLVERGWVFVRG